MAIFAQNISCHYGYGKSLVFLIWIITILISILLGKSSKDSKSKEKDKEKEANKELSSVQAVATLGVAVIALAEETGAEMCTRIFGQLVSTIQDSWKACNRLN